MEKYVSPLQKYKRQPKLYIDLPSKGIWYPKDILEKAENLEVYSMTANDEIGLKTPDALYSGIAVKKLIESCVPGIKDAWYVSVIDLDYILAAIRLATYSDSIELSTKCSKCGNADDYALPIQPILDHLQQANPNYETSIQDFKFKLRPLCYKELTELQQKIFQIRRTLQQHVLQMDDSEAKEKQLNELYDKLRDHTFDGICSAIIEITTPEGETETKNDFITQFVKFSDKDFYEELSKVYENNRKMLELPGSKIKCSSCGTESTVIPELDYSNFFVRR